MASLSSKSYKDRQAAEREKMARLEAAEQDLAQLQNRAARAIERLDNKQARVCWWRILKATREAI